MIKKQPKQPTKLVNHIIFILDESGSMSSLRNEVIKNYDDQIQQLRKEELKSGQETLASIYTFNYFDNIQERVSERSIQTVTFTEYQPNGNTALLDAIGEAVNDINASAKNHSYLVIVMTDGYENASRRYTKIDIKNLIEAKQSTDLWSFVFLAPPGYRYAIEKLGIPPGNIREWEGTARGLYMGTQAVNQSFTGYYAGRAVGQTMTRSFFETDLSKVNKTDLVQLLDVKPKFKSYVVDKEMDIKTFVEYKLARPYVLGSTYYQLTKKEKVQPHKKMLVEDKKSTALYWDARGVLGLPQYDEVVVTPGNHETYNIYVQSTSTNRKLVRGTKVWVEK
jgi:hypothetical protein